MSERNEEDNTQEKMELEEDLDLALQREVSKNQNKFLPQLEELKRLASQKEEILAAQTFANKEFHCPNEGEGTSGDDEVTFLGVRIDEQLKALLNHRIVKDTLQSASFDIQMQEAVRDSMKKVDVEDTMDNLPERGLLLSHCSSNLHTCKELVSVMEKNINIEREILELQMEYSSLLTGIREKWEALQNRFMQAEGETQELVSFQNKLKDREGKVQVLVTMVQNVIAASGFHWGANDYHMQMMILCDLLVRDLDTPKQDAIMKEISRLHKEDDDKENKGAMAKNA